MAGVKQASQSQGSDEVLTERVHEGLTECGPENMTLVTSTKKAQRDSKILPLLTPQIFGVFQRSYSSVASCFAFGFLRFPLSETV